MPRTRGKVEVSLFPFLSVLCCMIGVFMLFLVAILSTRVIDAEEDPAYQPSPREEKRRKADRDDPDTIDADSYRALEERLIALTGQLASRHAQRDELLRRLETLRAALDAKREELGVGQLVAGRRPVELDKPDPVRPVPDPKFRVPKKPVYIEISAEGFLVQPDKVRYAPLTKKSVAGKDEYTASREFKQFLDKVNEAREHRYLLLLVHPNGAEGYQALYNYLTKEFKGSINVGKEPFSQDWQFIGEQSQP